MSLVYSTGLNENGPQRLVGSSTIRRRGPVVGSMSLGLGFEVSKAQPMPRGSLTLPAAYRSGCRTLRPSPAPCLPALYHDSHHDANRLNL